MNQKTLCRQKKTPDAAECLMLPIARCSGVRHLRHVWPFAASNTPERLPGPPRRRLPASPLPTVPDLSLNRNVAQASSSPMVAANWKPCPRLPKGTAVADAGQPTPPLRADGTAQSGQSMGWFSGLGGTALNPGDTVVVPEKIDRSTFMQSLKEWTSIFYQFGLGAAGLKVLKN